MVEDDKASNLTALRQALAISRLIALQRSLEEESKKGFDPDGLQGLFEKIHRTAYGDWQERHDTPFAPGVTTDAKKKAELGKIIKILYDPENEAKSLFTKNQYALHYGRKGISRKLADFYHEVRKLKPFDYGNELTLDFFMWAIGNTRAFRANYGDIDLRRMSEQEIRILHDSRSGKSELEAAFLHSLTDKLTPRLKNNLEGYKSWPMRDMKIDELKFLSVDPTEVECVDNNGQKINPSVGKCLVRVDGGLVPLNKIEDKLRREINSPTQLADFSSIPNDLIIGHLKGTEQLKMGKSHIDGFAPKDGGWPLFCLSANILTGLTKVRHDAFMDLLDKTPNNGKKGLLHDLNEGGGGAGESYKNRLLEAAKGDSALRHSVEIAYEHINRITKKLDQKRDEKFVGKTSLEDTGKKPKIFMSLGGPGSGKSSVEDVARIHCEENFVTTSLDKFRNDSDLYSLLIAAGHHGDDYGAVEPFANALRTWVADHAIEKRFNLLYDGTGIEFEPKYGNIIRKAKKLGYETEIIGAERDIDVASKEVLKRAGEDNGRTLPWKIVVEKHRQMPSSFIAALKEPAVDKISLFCLDDPGSPDNPGKFDKDYLIAESFILSDEEVGTLKARQTDGTLATHFLNNFIKGENRPDSFLQRIAGKQIVKEGNTKTIPDIGELTKRIGLSQDNVTYITYPISKDRNRMLAIYDNKRFAQMMEKAAFNIEASGPDGRETPSDALKFLPHGSWRAAVGRDDKSKPARS